VRAWSVEPDPARDDDPYSVVEAPRGTLFHQYETDDQGLIRKANLIVATQNNSARIALSVDKAARGLIKKGQVNDGLLNMVDGFPGVRPLLRLRDPCVAWPLAALGQDLQSRTQPGARDCTIVSKGAKVLSPQVSWTQTSFRPGY
jgi:coenzyme F420-reducing hydrogenase alpha subunit